GRPSTSRRITGHSAPCCSRRAWCARSSPACHMPSDSLPANPEIARRRLPAALLTTRPDGRTSWHRRDRPVAAAEELLSMEPSPTVPEARAPSEQSGDADASFTVSTHVLVPEEDVRRLRALSARTRVAQSDSLREAVEDLLKKYGVEP